MGSIIAICKNMDNNVVKLVCKVNDGSECDGLKSLFSSQFILDYEYVGK